jgi:hypothetical protein
MALVSTSVHDVDTSTIKLNIRRFDDFIVFDIKCKSESDDAINETEAEFQLFINFSNYDEADAIIGKLVQLVPSVREAK